MPRCVLACGETTELSDSTVARATTESDEAASETGLVGADQDPAALLAAQHLVLSGGGDVAQVGGIHLQPAAGAASLHELGGADSGVGGGDLGVQGEQVGGQLGGQAVTGSPLLGGLGLDHGELL